MLKARLPVRNYELKDYPALKDNPGSPIPLIYGIKKNVVPTCVDTVNNIFKLCDHELYSVDAVRDGDAVWVEGSDYTVDLVNGEITIFGSPFLLSGVTYFLEFSGSWAINGVDFTHLVGSNNNNYAGGELWVWNGSSWSQLADCNLGFSVWGSTSASLEGEESRVAYDYAASGGVATGFNFRDGTARTKYMQKFTVGADAFYLTKVKFPVVADGVVSGNITVQIYASDKVTPIGTSSQALAVDSTTIGWYSIPWNLRGAPSSLEVDVKGKSNGGVWLTNVADVIEDLYMTVGGLPVDLNSVDLTALYTARPEMVSLYIDSATTLGEVIGKLEIGQFFKFVPDLGTKYAVRFVTESTPSFKTFYDEDYISFKMTHDVGNIFKRIKITYGMDPLTRDAIAYEVDNNTAWYVYRKDEVLSIASCLDDRDDNIVAALKYVKLLGERNILVVFEVGCAKGLDLEPFHVITLNRATACYEGGKLEKVEFVVLGVNKDVMVNSAVVTCILKTQMY